MPPGKRIEAAILDTNKVIGQTKRPMFYADQDLLTAHHAIGCLDTYGNINFYAVPLPWIGNSVEGENKPQKDKKIVPDKKVESHSADSNTHEAHKQKAMAELDAIMKKHNKHVNDMQKLMKQYETDYLEPPCCTQSV